jgi:cell division protein FtsI/penicillin-binding protein 2
MIKPTQYRRLGLAAVLLLVAFAGLGYRLVDLQVIRHDEFVAHIAGRQKRVLRASQRGDIIDSHGVRLATTILVKTVVADPKLIGTNPAVVATVVRTLSPLLKMDPTELADRLLTKTFKDRDGIERERRSVTLRRQVAFEDWERIRAAMANLNFGVDLKRLPSSERQFYQRLKNEAITVEATDGQMRAYPNRTLAANVIGHVNTDDKRVDGLAASALKGVDGIEARFDSVLNGVFGWKQTETAANRDELVVFRGEDVSSRPGLNVVLTLDATIQSIIEAELATAMTQHLPLSASAVVVRPKTGEIVAMATLPSFDPNQPGRDTPVGNLRNRIIADEFEPGSTFKTIVLAGALNERTVALEDHFFCENGAFQFAGHVLHDAGHRFGDLSVEEIVAHSSNIGAAKVGLKLGPNLLYRYIRGFGFGDRTGIPLQGEVRGTVHPVKNWSKVTIVQLPMGQGINATPLQMTLAIAAIANGGLLMRPMLVDRLEDQDGDIVKQYQPEQVRQVVSASAARMMVQAMKRAVSKDGTGVKAQLTHYTVAGKTGTAEKVPYKSGRYYASFIGFLPADNPEICIAVFIDQPDPKRGGYYGSETAAPVFQRIAQRAAVQLGIRPDIVSPDDVAPASAEAYSDTRRF